MNCKHVEELLPLYAGHDLEDESDRLIAAHLQNCTACASSARKYDQANQLLQQFESPQFSDAAYAAVRRNVLREIESGSSAFSLRELILSPFQPRVRWAFSTAVLLVVCAFAYYSIADRSNRIVPDSHAVVTATPNPGSNQIVRPGREDVQPPPVKSSRGPRLNPPGLVPRHFVQRGEKQTVAVNSVQSLPEQPNIKPLNTAVTSDKSLRVEIQTKDPNIRIIWFSHPSPNEGSPNESSKGI
jgi:hypothetical protein